MPKQVLRTVTIWMCGSNRTFNIYENTTALNAFQYRGSQSAPARHQKNQIVLHYTAGNNNSDSVIGWWNTLATLPNYICTSYFTGHQYGRATKFVCTTAGCNWGSNAQGARCPTHNAATGKCPNNHNMKKGRGYGSAQLIVERAADRTNASELYTDCVEVIDLDQVAYHGGVVNQNSIGIEISNNGWAHSANWGSNNNDRFCIPAANAAIRGERNYQAYEEEQYLSLILLLRYLHITHRIPRRFLGNTTEEKMKRWWHRLPAAEQMSTRSKLMRFRGILSHMNCHDSKACGGPALNRNRLFRGIIDEWWLPVDFSSDLRPYYHGPFDPQVNVASFCRLINHAAHLDLYRDADLDALQETKSYYDIDSIDFYYSNVERVNSGGYFPIGLNKVWHGGVHLFPQGSNKHVYTAASGTIVAARLGGNSTTEQDPDFGSQRFVLIRHCVYLEREADPSGQPGDMRINYNVDPHYVFTLYMHLKQIQSLTTADNLNPPWFNYWFRNNRQSTDDPNGIFLPNVQVMVGDWIGECGTFGGQSLVHFEVVSNEEYGTGNLAHLTPWTQANMRIYDPHETEVFTQAVMDQFLQNTLNTNDDDVDPLLAAEQLHNAKLFHLSEWGLTSAESLIPVVPNADRRTELWNHLQHFMWVPQVLQADPTLVNQLSDQQGRMWHYHPFTFMKFLGNLILEENREVNETDNPSTNVIIEDDYITRFVSYGGNPPVTVSQQADNAVLRPFEVSNNNFNYYFRRSDLACNGHNPQPDTTKFHIELLNVLETIQKEYNADITISLAHVCTNHNIPAEQARCVLGGAQSLNSHHLGLAVDFAPTSLTPANCSRLWSECQAVITEVNTTHENHAGQPSQSELAEGTFEFTLSAAPAIQNALEHNIALTNSQAQICIFHLEMGEATRIILWNAWIRRPSTATASYVHVPSRQIRGRYESQAEALAEALPNTTVTLIGDEFEAILVQNTNATSTGVDDDGLYASYQTRDEAENEKSAEFAWPVEMWS